MIKALITMTVANAASTLKKRYQVKESSENLCPTPSEPTEDEDFYMEQFQWDFPTFSDEIIQAIFEDYNYNYPQANYIIQ